MGGLGSLCYPDSHDGISRSAPFVDLLLSYIGGLASILVALGASLKDVLLVVATVSLTARLFMTQPRANVAVKAPEPSSSTGSACSFCGMSNHSVTTCFKKKRALQAQIDAIETAAKERAQDMLSANLLIVSHDDRRNRRIRIRKSASVR